MDDEHGSILQTSRLLDSVPAVAVNENEEKATSYGLEENSFIFPRNNGANVQHDQTIDILPQFGRLEQQPPLNWSSICSVSSYAQYFNVDTDVVINRLLCSLYPLHGDFFSKIDANPDLYGLVWVSTSLLFMLGSLGNCATYLLQKHANHSHAKWAFDVGYVKTAACSAYGYAILVPLSFYFFLKYLGANASLVRLLCMWGYSLFIFILSSFLLVIPLEVLRWIIILLAGIESACFVALNLKSCVQGSKLMIIPIASFCVQMALAIFIKLWFFS